MTKRELKKEIRMNIVIEAAANTFEASGIEQCKMTDIAEAADIGVASLYRYFKTKSDIAIEVGIKYWHEARDKTKKVIDDNQTGFINIENMLSMYTEQTKESEVFFQFIEQFDNFVVKLEKQPLKMNDYESAIADLIPIFESQIIKGQSDGSIDVDIDIKTTLTMMNHTLMALKQKHCSRGLVIKSDSLESQVNELNLLIKIFLNYLRY